MASSALQGIFGKFTSKSTHSLKCRYIIYDLCLFGPPKILQHPCRILKKCIAFGGSDTHLEVCLKNPSNIELMMEGVEN